MTKIDFNSLEELSTKHFKSRSYLIKLNHPKEFVLFRLKPIYIIGSDLVRILRPKDDNSLTTNWFSLTTVISKN